MPVVFTDGTLEEHNPPNIFESDITITPRELEEPASHLKYVRLDLLTRAKLVNARQIINRKQALGDTSVKPLGLFSWRFNKARKGKSMRSFCWVKAAMISGNQDQLEEGNIPSDQGRCDYCMRLNTMLARCALGEAPPDPEIVAEGSQMYGKCIGLQFLVQNILTTHARLVAEGKTRLKLGKTLCHPWSTVAGTLTQLKLDALR